MTAFTSEIETSWTDHLRHHLMPPTYKSHTLVKVAAVGVVTTIVLIALGATGHLPPPSSLLNRPINPLLASSVSSAVVVLFTGSLLVIGKVIKEQKGGKLVGSTQWKPCLLKTYYEGNPTYSGYVDISTLDETKSGTAYVYTKMPADGRTTGILAAIFLPVYLVGIVVYHAIRFCVIPFYLLVQLYREHKTGKTLFPDQRQFAVSDIPKEMFYSLESIVKAPFYGIALFFSALYAIVDPLNGVQLGGLIELDWNRFVPLGEGIWLIQFKASKKWKWEGGGGPEHLGENGFYFAGSWQRMLELTFKDGEVREIKNVAQVYVEAYRDCEILFSDDFFSK